MKHILRFIKNQPPARLIVAGFFLIILTGACFLMLPVSLRPGVHTSFLDALFTATSATCVTGLVTVDPGDTYTVFGPGDSGAAYPDRRSGLHLHGRRPYAGYQTAGRL